MLDDLTIVDNFIRAQAAYPGQVSYSWNRIKNNYEELAQQPTNSAMDAIALQKELFIVFSKYMSSADSSGLVKEVLAVVQQHQ